jgi:hypothetical protein
VRDTSVGTFPLSLKITLRYKQQALYVLVLYRASVTICLYKKQSRDLRDNL